MKKIVADSACDILTVNNTAFASVPLTIYTDERTFTDDASLQLKEMLDYLASYEGRSYTSCPSVDAWLSAFEGADEIFVCTVTSGLSGSYNSAGIAKEMYLQDHPDAKIHVIDTLSAGPEIRLVIEKIAELIDHGNTFEDICTKIHDFQKRSRVFFSFRSLHNFAQNGRVSKVVAAAAGILGIRIVGSGSPEGKIEPIAKCRGDKKALAEILKQMEDAGFRSGKVLLSHTENEELAAILKESILKKYPDAKVIIYPARGLCSYYGERGGIFLGFEGAVDYKFC